MEGLVVEVELVDDDVAVVSGVVEVEADGCGEDEAAASGEDVVGAVEVEVDESDEAVRLTVVPEADGVIAVRSGNIWSVTPAEALG